jgi:hypothetical protein
VKYWGYFCAKLAAAGAALYGVRWALIASLPVAEPYTIRVAQRGQVRVPADPFAHDLAYTFAMLLFTLLAVGVLWAILWDQRYRCRTCLRRLRMPILKGSWTHVLLGAPRTEYICPYGHGTLRVEELQITGHQEPDWEPHEDIWKELYSLEAPKK